LAVSTWRRLDFPDLTAVTVAERRLAALRAFTEALEIACFVFLLLTTLFSAGFELRFLFGAAGRFAAFSATRFRALTFVLDFC
jgi:hypothetical protein